MIKAKKGPNQKKKKKDLGVFCEKLPFDSLFSSESYTFSMVFLCLLKISHVRLYIVEKWGLERLLDDVGFIPNLSYYYRKLAFFMSLKP